MRSKRAIANIISGLILQIIVIIYGFVVPKMIISSFGSSVNGMVESITQFLAYIVLLESGFGPVVKSLLYKPIAKQDKESIQKILKSTESFFRKISLFFFIYIVILVIVFPLFINDDFSFGFTATLIIIIAISTFAEYFFGMTYTLYLQAEQKSYVISIIQSITYIISIVAVVLMVKLGMSIQSIKIVTSLIFVTRPLLQSIYVRKKYNIKLNKITEKSEIKQKWDGLAQHVASVIHSNTDVVIITIFCSLVDVSIYSVYYLVIKGIKSLMRTFTNGMDALFGNMIANNEQDNLRKKFDIYETLFLIISIIIYTCTFILIAPFISVYTADIIDANYVNYLFGYLLVIGEFIWILRIPYSTLVHSSGHFKQTRIGAWIEAIVNIVVSIALVFKWGIIGVAVGTILAMIIRTIEMIWYANKNILKRNIFTSAKKMMIAITEAVIIIFISYKLFTIDPQTYSQWFVCAIIVLAVSIVIVGLISLIFQKQYFIEICKILKKILRGKQDGNHIIRQ
ncbi:MAG: polysaccharide biosynthesis C-terminal domain-containing protein [Bacilli bacterium]|nr:polysaccharide biosynthesis C-terminal domain-containing protein [Bacilli bacterium]